MKIGIVTITEGQNYGNILQNYALQRTLSEMGNNVVTIDLITHDSIESNIGIGYFALKMIYRRMIKGANDFPYLQRRKQFLLFKRKYINTLKIKARKARRDYNEDGIELFVFGSDQIWNPYFKIIQENRDFYFGEGMKNKISYAASFGVNDLPSKWTAYIAEKLSSFRFISVRETAGKAILNELLKKNVEVMPDPTILLSGSEWRRIERIPVKMEAERDYILTYFLGNIKDEKRRIIMDYAKKKGVKVINLNNSLANCKTSLDLQNFSVSPQEFIWYMDHACCVLTDSFHGTVFSLLLGKPFFTFPREAVEAGNNMESRIVTLLTAFDEMDRYIQFEKLMQKGIIQIDAYKTENIRKKLSGRGIEYLKHGIRSEYYRN